MGHTTQRSTPPKTGSVKRTRKEENNLVDLESKESFPASDPPSYNSGSAIGAPKKRETPAPRIKDFEEAAKNK